MAYAHFDPEVNYCQGMNIVAAWLLKYLQEPNFKGQLEYNEEDAFFMLIHVCVRLRWRDVYIPSMIKFIEMSTLIEEILSTTYPKVHKHMEMNSDLRVQDMFQRQIITIFISELSEHNPELATHIFDVFLLEGEIVFYTLIIKFIEHSHDKILELDDENLDKFIINDMPRLCLDANPLYELLDFHHCLESE